MNRTGWSLVATAGVALLVYLAAGYTDQQVVDNTTYRWSVWTATQRLGMAGGAALTVAGLIFRRVAEGRRP